MARIGLAIATLSLAALPGMARAAEPERSGAEIVSVQCSKCHETGVKGAPRIDDKEAWVPRMKRGLDATVRSAIKGHGAMPARGGLADLTDTELRAAILYLFNPAGIPPQPAAAPAPGPNQRIVDGTEIYLGVKLVRGVVHHVNITLRDSQTHAAIGDAIVEAHVTNPVMGSETKKLNRVMIGGTASYGNDFRITGKEPHTITVQIRRPGSLRIIETKFDFRG